MLLGRGHTLSSSLVQPPQQSGKQGAEHKAGTRGLEPRGRRGLTERPPSHWPGAGSDSKWCVGPGNSKVLPTAPAAGQAGGTPAFDSTFGSLETFKAEPQT